MKKAVLISAVALMTLSSSLIFWQLAWKYESHKFRVHRVSGKVERYQSGKWVKMMNDSFSSGIFNSPYSKLNLGE